MANRAFGPGVESHTIVSYRAHAAAISSLAGTIDTTKNFALLCGPKGSGKTVITNVLAGKYRQDRCVAVMDGSSLNVEELTSELLEAWNCNVRLTSVEERLDLLHVIAVHRARISSGPILIVENIERMKPATLRLLCTLADFSAGGRPAIRIVLTGGAESKAVLSAQEMVSIASRITHVIELGPLSPRESINYLYSRLAAAGKQHPDRIMPIDVCERLHELAGGWPGELNLLANRVIKTADRLPLRIGDMADEVASQVPDSAPTQPTTQSQSHQEPCLIVSRSGKVLQTILLSDKKTSIGRSQFADVQLDHYLVSKFHALVLARPEGLAVFDLNSTNGTYVNSRKVSSVALHQTDIISIADFRIKVARARSVSVAIDPLADTSAMKTLDEQRRERRDEGVISAAPINHASKNKS